MISFGDIIVRYPCAVTNALDGVSIDVMAGAVTAVTGPNGSGKSTLVRALLRRVLPVSGKIRIDGDDAVLLGARELALRIAVVPQREEITFPIRVRDYVALGRYPRLGLWRSASAPDRSATESAMHRAGVLDLIDRETDALSGGEWQRVRIARALAQETKALVLDEPTTFLDMSHEMSLFELVNSLAASGMTILLVSHQLNLVARFATKVVLLNRGRVAAAGSPDEVMQAPLLESVYGWPLVVTRDPAVGSPSLLPLRRRGPAADTRIDLQ